jgi:hypothetical protein
VDRYELEVDGDRARVVVHAAASGMGTPVMDLWTPAGVDASDAHGVEPWGTRWRARPVETSLETESEAPT